MYLRSAASSRPAAPCKRAARCASQHALSRSTCLRVCSICQARATESCSACPSPACLIHPGLGQAGGVRLAQRSTTARAAPAAVQDVSGPTNPKTAGVVIVGGGPVGYTTAIALAQKGFKDILVLEQAPSAYEFDPTKGYVFSITGTAREVLSNLGITDLIDIGLTRPDGPTHVKYVNLDGSIKETQFAVGGRNTWIQRHRFLALLYDHIQANHSDAVKILFDTQVTSVDIADDESSVVVHARSTPAASAPDDSEASMRFAGRLVVAADGANSRVRQALEKARPGDGWRMHEAPSDAAGLNIKVLPLPPCPVLSTRAGPLDNQANTVVPGKSVDGAAPLRLGLLGIKSRDEPRTANFILWPDHPFWDVSTVDDLYRYLEAAFPQLDRLREAVPRDTAQRFLDSKPLAFKAPQVCQKLLAEIPTTEQAEVAADDAASGIKGCAVVLLGDAAHVFPPDLGQGVNSSVLDVDTLAQCLEEHPHDVGAALRAYEAARLPENKALQRMMQVGNPYQYRQAKMEVQKFFHGINLIARVLLSKLLPSLIAPPVALVAVSGKCDARQTLYQDMLSKANSTTRLLLTCVTVMAVGGVYLAARAAELV